jgi:hypothetical protein
MALISRRTAASARASKPTIRGRRRAYSNFWPLPRRLKMANIRGPSLGLLPKLGPVRADRVFFCTPNTLPSG